MKDERLQSDIHMQSASSSVPWRSSIARTPVICTHRDRRLMHQEVMPIVGDLLTYRCSLFSVCAIQSLHSSSKKQQSIKQLVMFDLVLIPLQKKDFIPPISRDSPALSMAGKLSHALVIAVSLPYYI